LVIDGKILQLKLPTPSFVFRDQRGHAKTQAQYIRSCFFTTLNEPAFGKKECKAASNTQRVVRLVDMDIPQAKTNGAGNVSSYLKTWLLDHE